MKQIIDALSSTKLTVFLLAIFIVAIGGATFIEDRFDTITAKILVYDSKWLEVIYILLVLNFIGHIKRYHLLRVEKLPGLLFHIAFIVIIIGAGITRYSGMTGMMHIREGHASDIIYTTDPYLQVVATGENKKYSSEKLLYLSEITNNSFKKWIRFSDQGIIKIRYKNYIRNAVEKISENIEGGSEILEFAVVGKGHMETVFLREGEVKMIGGIPVAFNNKERADAILVFSGEENLNFISPVNIVTFTMMESGGDTIQKSSISALREKYIYKTENSLFLFNGLHNNAKLELARGDGNEQGTDILVLEVTHKDRKQDVVVQGDTDQASRFVEIDLDGIRLQIAYGSKVIRLPFSLYLEDFLLDRYPGSMSPSSFESKVVLMDERNNLEEKHRIFMNKVLDYDGYRFFQSSYDEDERGTILSVNHDFIGTWVSYLGYFLLGAGFLMTLINRRSWFYALRNKIREIRIKRKEGLLILFLAFGLHGISFSQSLPRKPVSHDHAEKFGQLNVQTYNGRFEPMHTLAMDVMHKISRKDDFETPGKGKMDFMQVFMDMMLDPEFWKQQRIIYIREKSVRDVLGVQGKYAAFNDFFNSRSEYKLSEFIEVAFRKKQAEQNKFDKEIIKVDERLNICLMIFDGSLLRIFPGQETSSHNWISGTDTLAHIPLSGPVGVIRQELRMNVLNYHNLLQDYFRDLLVSIQTGDYSRPEKILNYIKAFQDNSNSADLLPSGLKVKLEVHYNKARIFVQLRNIYGMLSMILLLLAFVDSLSSRKNRLVQILLTFFISVLGLAFLYHTYGMGLRWYLSGHAPWSNGYEALLLIAWGSLLAGFIYMRDSKITIASTALLAFFILMTAGHSNYDPQLTNLQPVLKSYWLIIHVAVITISYGFLGSGFILGIINLLISLFKTPKNSKRIDLTIEELTSINAMNLTIGLFLATLGTFLGGIWANESWGRYWGWDAKETWALIIVIAYAMVLHLRLVPGLRSLFIFNAASVISFGSVIMTFVGVNYYLSKGLHSYAADETPIFPLWAWVVILSIIGLIIIAGMKDKSLNERSTGDGNQLK